jgi:hypothetical protein
MDHEASRAEILSGRRNPRPSENLENMGSFTKVFTNPQQRLLTDIGKFVNPGTFLSASSRLYLRDRSLFGFIPWLFIMCEREGVRQLFRPLN